MPIQWMFLGTTEASDLGLAPGEWPATISIALPNGKSATLKRNSVGKEESIYLFVAPNGEGPDVKLIVLND